MNNKQRLKIVADANKRLVRYQANFTKPQQKEFNQLTIQMQSELKNMWHYEIIGPDGKPNLEPFNEQPYLLLIGMMHRVAKKVRRKN